MHYMSDEELFGMIPKHDGTLVDGNALLPLPSFKRSYLDALTSGKIVPTNMTSSFRYTPGLDEEKAVDLMRKHSLHNALGEIYEKAFPLVDQAIEDHLEETNGYIYSFPPSEIQLYEDTEDFKFNYFRNAPEEYHPPLEKRLNKAYNDVHQELEGELPKAVSWMIMITLAFALVLIGGRIYTIFPQLGAWVAESGRNENIFMACIAVFLVIAGWVSVNRMETVESCLAHVVVIGGICFLGPACIALTGDPNLDRWVDTLMRILFVWPVRIYFGGLWLIFVASFVRFFADRRHYRKNVAKYQETYLRIFKEDYNKLRRYLRLRQLWSAYEGKSDAGWVRDLSNRLQQYRAEYEAISQKPEKQTRNQKSVDLDYDDFL